MTGRNFQWRIVVTDNSLVLDTSVLIELERGNLQQACFQLPYSFCVPDILFEIEWKDYGGEELLNHGLQIIVLGEIGYGRAQEYQQQVPALSAADCSVLALASVKQWIILSDDREIRKFAHQLQVEYHGTLWLLDKIESTGTASLQDLLQGIDAIADDPRCRQPVNEIQKRRLRLQNKLRVGDAGNRPR